MVGPSFLWCDDNVIGLRDSDAKLIDRDGNNILSVCLDDLHLQAWNADIKIAHSGSIDETEPDTLAWHKLTCPWGFGGLAVRKKGIARNVGQICWHHSHFTPCKPVVDGRSQTLFRNVIKKVEYRALRVIIIVAGCFQVRMHVSRIIVFPI